MARPTINFPADGHITAAGTYYFEVPIGVPTSIIAIGDFDGQTMTLQAYNPAADGTQSVAGGSWTAAFEDTITSPYAVMSLAILGTPDIYITLAQKKAWVHPT